MILSKRSKTSVQYKKKTKYLTIIFLLDLIK